MKNKTYARPGWALFVLGFLLASAFSAPLFAGEIALTFDDAPMPSSNVFNGKTRTERLINELEKAKVKEVLFFVTSKYLDNEESQDRLRAYTNAGHLLANHSHNHTSANELPVDEFLIDAYRAHLHLKKFDNTLALYRFPYLHYGPDADSRKAITAGLAELGYDIGYVTVDNFDWYIDAVYRKAVEEGKKINIEKLGQLYVNTLWDNIQFYDDIAKKTLGRSPKHVLLLHENDLAAMFIGKLVQRIESEGWKTISPKDAYQDPISRIDYDLRFTKQGRVAAIAAHKGAPIETLRHKNENAAQIDLLFQQYEIFGN